MTRSYAPIYTSIWQDDAFTDLNDSAQRLYFLINSQADITHCGVLIYNERRWCKWARNTTQETILRDLGELCDAGFVAFDEATDEVWVRSYMKHNKVLAQPGLCGAALKQFDTIHSKGIKWAVWEIIQTLEDDRKKSCVMPSRMPLPMPSGVAQVVVSKALVEEPEPRQKPEHQPPVEIDTATDDDDDDDLEMPIGKLLDATWLFLGERKAEIAKEPIADFARWFHKSVRPDLVKRHTSKAEEILATQPWITPEQLAYSLEPHLKPKPDKPPDPTELTAAAQRKRTEQGDSYLHEMLNDPQDFETGKSQLAAMKAALQ